MIELYGILQEQESINAELGLGVDYYKGEPGEQGIPGKDGKTPVKGVDYFTDAEITEIKDEIAEKVQVGAKGEDGKSAYQLAVEAGYEGSEADWLASLKGTDGRNGIDGINGTNGKDGKTPVKGVDYFTTAEINEIEEGAAAKVDLSNYAKTADLSTVATSGSYNDLSDKPSIPEPYELPVASTTALGGVKVGSGLSITNGVLSATGGGVADAVDWSKVQNKPNFANVATSGDYNDLSNKPTIPSVEGLASEAYVNEKVAAIVIPEVPTKVSELENDKGYLTEHQSLEGYAKTADLAQVAKTGSYNDLIDKPTIPSTTGLATETYVDDKIAEIDIPTVPTKVSAFTNDAGYLTEHQSLIEYAKKTDIPAPYTLPTASTSTLGGVKVDGTTTTVDVNGILQVKIDNDTIIVKDGSMCVDKSQLSASNGLPTGGYFSQILVKNSSNNFDSTWLNLSDALLQAGINLGGGGWQYTQDQYNSDLYNAKEVAIWINTTNNNKLMGYFNFGYTEGGSSTTLGQNWQGTNFYLGENDSSPYIIYDGSCLNCVNANYVQFILYKT